MLKSKTAPYHLRYDKLQASLTSGMSLMTSVLSASMVYNPLQDWKRGGSLTDKEPNYRAYESDVPNSVPAPDLQNFPMKMVKVTETGAASGVQRFSFQISVEDRSRYEGDFIRGPEWKRLIEALELSA